VALQRGWCLAEGYRNGDQRRLMGPCGSGRTLLFFNISMKFCQFVANLYPHMLIGQFILLFNKMALFFLEILIIFTVSSFEFQQFRLP